MARARQKPAAPRRSAPAPRWHRRKESRAEELVAAALVVFGEHGFAAARLEDVARQAGVTKGTIYLYFQSKEALFEAAMRESVVPLLAAGEREAAEFTGPTPELIRRILLSFWNNVGRTPLAVLPRIIIAEATHFPAVARLWQREVAERGQRLLADAYRRGVKRGEFRELDPAMAARLAVWPIVMAVTLSQSVHRCVPVDFDMDVFVHTHVDQFLRAVAKQPE